MPDKNHVSKNTFCIEHGWTPHRTYDAAISALGGLPYVVGRAVTAADTLADKFGQDKNQLLAKLRAALDAAITEAQGNIPLGPSSERQDTPANTAT